jgi:C1A family cysteine protease
MNVMAKTLLSSLVAVAALTSALAGCGISPSFNGATSLSPADLDAMAKKITSSGKFGLGCEIAGTPVVQDDEGAGAKSVDDDGLTAMAALPTKVDLRSQCPPVHNQQQFGSCTAFSIAKGLNEFILKKEHRYTELSAGYLWYQERKALHKADQDCGAPISLGMKILDNLGSVPEQEHPYPTDWSDKAGLAKFLTLAPTSSEVTDAKKFRVAGVKQLNSLHAIRASVAKGMPVVFGIAVYESFEGAGPAKTGVVPMPDTSKEKLMGGHAVLCVGYDNTKQVLIMRNSWGADWGDKGYFYLPYDFTKQGLVHDAWTAKL